MSVTTDGSITMPADVSRLPVAMDPDLTWLGGRYATATFEWTGPEGDLSALSVARWEVINGAVIEYERDTQYGHPMVTYTEGHGTLWSAVIAFTTIAKINPNDMPVIR